MNTQQTAKVVASVKENLTPSKEELVARADGLRAQLWADAPEADRNRRLSDKNATAIKDAGLMSLFTPRRLGGYQANLRTLVEVTTAIGRGDGAAGWITGITNAGAYMAGLFNEQAQNEVWGSNPRATVTAILAPTATSKKVDGGYRVTGKWGYMSGCLHSDWACICFPLEEMGGAPAIGLVPMHELTQEDTWFVTGLRGTGSNTVIANDLFIPDHRAISLMAASGGQPPSMELIEKFDEKLYLSSFSGILLVALLGTLVGEAEAALEIVVEKAPSRPITASNYKKQTDSVAFVLDVAEASALIETAKVRMFAVADDIDSHAQRGVYPDDASRAKARLSCAWVAKTVREAVDLLMTAHGTSAFAENNPLARIWRDTAIAARHAGLGARIPQEVYGRTMLGLDPRTVSFLL